MIEEKDVWYNFQLAKGKNVDYPSDRKWESIKKRLSQKNKENIEEIVKYFNTIWQNINIYTYFQTGCNLWKTFSYDQFLNPKIVELYKKRDKSKKRKKVSNKDLLQSVTFVINNNYTLKEYGQEKIENLSLPVYDYLEGNIDCLLVVYMIEKGMLKLDKYEWDFIPYITDRYNELRKQLKEKWNLLLKMEKEIMSKKENKNKYLDDPEKNSEEPQNEDELKEVLYGDGETVQEKEKKKKEYQDYQLNE